MVALLIASTVVLLVHQIWATTLAASHRLRSARHLLDRSQGAHGFLAATFLSVEVGGGAGAFEGHPESLRFDAWMQTPDGWFERRSLALSMKDGRLGALISPANSVVLADSVVAAHFDYLLEIGADARWVDEWISPVSAPFAVRLVIARATAGGKAPTDTVVYLIKQRG
jgi:hypothetical protein